MKFIISFCVLILTVYSCSETKRTSTVPFTIANDRCLITVSIGDLEIPEILLDTGFAFDGLMIYNPSYLDSINLDEATEVRIGGAGSGAASTALMLDSATFRLGDIQMTGQRLIVLKSDLYKGFPSNGIIGYSIFGHYITEFNYDHQQMMLHHSDSLEIDDSWSALPVYFKHNKIPWLDVSVVIENEPPTTLSTYIDFAAGDAIVILERTGMKVSLPEVTQNVHIGRGLSGDIYGKTGQISKLIIGPYELEDVKASFAPANVRSKQDNADAILGSASLRNFNLIFDYIHHKLYLKPNSHFNHL
jgi:predicted aspartyl protease